MCLLIYFNMKWYLFFLVTFTEKIFIYLMLMLMLIFHNVLELFILYNNQAYFVLQHSSYSILYKLSVWIWKTFCCQTINFYLYIFCKKNKVKWGTLLLVNANISDFVFYVLNVGTQFRQLHKRPSLISCCC